MGTFMEGKVCACALSFFDVMTAREELRKAVLSGKGRDAREWLRKLRERLDFLERDCGIDVSFEKEKLDEILRIPPWKEEKTITSAKEFLRAENIMEKIIKCEKGY